MNYYLKVEMMAMEQLNMDILITGNLAKVKVLQELSYLIEEASAPMKILDIGCGPSLEFWEPLLKSVPGFELYGIDVAGIDKATEVVSAKGWKNVRLMELSGYSLIQQFAEGFFDVAVATQVLEHIGQ